MSHPYSPWNMQPFIHPYMCSPLIPIVQQVMRFKAVEEQRAVLAQRNIKYEPDKDVKIIDSVDANDEDLTVVGQKVLKEWIDISELKTEQIRETQNVKNVKIQSCTDKEVRTAENQTVLEKIRRHELNGQSQSSLDKTCTETKTNRDERQTARQESDVVTEKGFSGETTGTIKHEAFRHFNFEPSQWHTCSNCSYRARTEKNLKAHIQRIHSTSTKPFGCTICTFVTKYKQSLKLHVKKKHAEDVQDVQWHLGDKCDSTKPFGCTVCTFTTKYKQSLKLHLQKKHTEEVQWLQGDKWDFKTRHKQGAKEDVVASSEKQIATDYCPNHANVDKECDCEKCNFKANIRKRFKEHFRKDGNRQSRYKMEECK